MATDKTNNDAKAAAKTVNKAVSVADDVAKSAAAAAVEAEQDENAEGTGHYIHGQNEAQKKASEG